MKNWADEGVPKSKLVMGLAFFGRSFMLSDTARHKPGDPSAGTGKPGEASESPGNLYYVEICERLKRGWTRVYDDETKTPYAYKGNEWVGYDDTESIRHKTELINHEGYAGAMIWQVDQDDANDLCGDGVYPMTEAVAEGLSAS